MPITPSPKREKTKGSSIWHTDVADLLAFGKPRTLPLKELAVFCRKASFLFNAGLPVKSVMPILTAQMPGRRLKAVASDVHKLVMQGESFTKSIKNAEMFPIFMCGYIEIGEKTAQLPKVCSQLADFYEQQADTEAELTAALMYPLVVSLMMIGVIVMAVTLVIPGYSDMFDASGIQLPMLTAVLIGLSDFLIANGLAVIVGLLGMIITMYFLLRGEKGQAFFARFKIKIPMLRLSANFRLVQALSILLSSGISVSQAVPLCREVMDNFQVKRDLGILAMDIGEGTTFWAALEKIPYIDPLFTGMVRVGEETGTLPQTIEKCRIYFESSYKFAIRRLNKLIEPVITLILGVILAAVMLAVVLPTFELATII